MRTLVLVAALLASGLLALGFFSGNWPFLALLALLPGVAALLGHWRSWSWLSALALTLFVGLAAAGVWLKAGPGWMLGGLIAALSAWDLSNWCRQLRAAGRVPDEVVLSRRHLGRLLAVDLVGLLLGGTALLLRLHFGLFWALVLGLLLIVGLTQAVSFLRQESE